MDPTEAGLCALEFIFLCSSSVFIATNITSSGHPLLSLFYLILVLCYTLGILRLRPARFAMMFPSPLATLNFFFYFTILLSKVNAQTTISPVQTFRPEFTVPAEADIGASLLPNIYDPEAVDAQVACPGYKASKIQETSTGLTALLTIAGEACNAYGNDVTTLDLTVTYQAVDRLALNIHPANLDAKNSSWFLLPDYLVPIPSTDGASGNASLKSDLEFNWSNDPTFSFSIVRKATGDVLFSTTGTKLIYEDQFVEFASELPLDYNLYGLGETIHGLRIGNNFTKVC